MRTYVAGDRALVEALAGGGRVTRAGIVAASEDELDEDDALYEAVGTAGCVVVADMGAAGDGFTLDDVAAFHLDVDGTGSLAWYAPQEITDVLDVLRSSD